MSRDKNALEALSYHYGHVHKAITDGSYGGSDIELRALLSEESRKDLGRALTDLIGSDQIAGKGGAAIRALRQEVKFRGKKGLKFLVEKLISEGVQLAPCNWGYCVYCRALSACRGDDSGPNEANRSPDVCAGCANFAATEHHRLWWEVRFERDERFLQRTGLGEQTITIVTRRLNNTVQILKHLNDRSRTAPTENEESVDGKDIQA